MNIAKLPELLPGVVGGIVLAGRAFPVRIITPCALALAALPLAACALQMTIMSRDSGQTYKGVAHPDGLGGGTISMTVDGRTYNGVMAPTLQTTVLVFIRLSAKTVPRAFFLLLAVITPAQQFFHRKTIMECDVSLRATELDMVVLFV